MAGWNDPGTAPGYGNGGGFGSGFNPGMFGSGLGGLLGGLFGHSNKPYDEAAKVYQNYGNQGTAVQQPFYNAGAQESWEIIKTG